ncbi:MAG: rRNA maturation RNase YbeY [Acidimicrobiales bacterium]
MSAVEVVVRDEQARHPVDTARWRGLAERVLEAEGVGGEAELTLLFVDDGTMADLNARFMDATGPTDVLSFPIDQPTETGPGPDGVPRLLGDVVICPSVAHANAPSHAGRYDDELALLVVHGVLHVLGLDHATPSDEASMQAREREHLERFHGPVPAATWTPGWVS